MINIVGINVSATVGTLVHAELGSWDPVFRENIDGA